MKGCLKEWFLFSLLFLGSVFFLYDYYQMKRRTFYICRQYPKESMQKVSEPKLENPENKQKDSNVDKKMTIIVRFTSTEKMLRRYFCQLLRSISFFWPKSYGNIILVLDKESKADQEFWSKYKNQIDSNLPGYSFSVHFEPMPKNPGILNFPGMGKHPGYNRQMWSTFWPDKYTDSEVIIYMDADSQFVLPITQQVLFKNDKPRVFGMDDFHIHGWMNSWDVTTRRAIGSPLVLNFMATFPQIIYRDTYTNCRNYILKYMNETDFEVAFHRFYGPGTIISPINTILSYAWFHERDRYSWHLKTNNLVNLNKRLPSNAKVKTEHTIPAVFPGIHVENTVSRPELMLYGYCVLQSVVNVTLPRSCKNVNIAKERMCDFHEGAFRGPGYNYKLCESEVQDYFNSLKLSYKRYEQPDFWADVKRTEAVASAHGVKPCEAFSI